MAEAQRAELKLARERAELVPLAEFEAELNRVVSALAAGLKSFPSRWAQQMVGLEMVAEGRAALERGVRELMEDLRKSVTEDGDVV